MKKINHIILILLGMVVFMTACQDDSYELGNKLDKSAVKYRIEQAYDIDEGGNTVVLINETNGTVPMWDYQTGRSTRMIDTVRYAFKGDYNIKFSVLTAGGVVEIDSVTITVTEDNLNYVDHPLYNNLTGGVGKEKTWIIDNGDYGLAKGPLAYADPSRKQVWGDYQTNWEPKGSDVGISEDVYEATMTFNLKGGPYMTTNKPNEGVEESGTYYIDINNYTLSTTGATIIRPTSFIANVSNWNEDLRILELTDKQLRVAVMRTNEEGPWWYILNYVEEEYAKNYVPPVKTDPNFDFGDQTDLLAVDRSTTKTWGLDLEVPYNWADLNGNLLNHWESRADIMATGWAPYGDEDVPKIDNASISFSEDGTVVVTQDDGTTEEGAFTINESKNIVTFEGVKPTIPIAGWVTATTTEDNQWKIVKTEKDELTDKVTGIWFGVRSSEKDEYMVYHFKLQNPGGAKELTPEELIRRDLAGSGSKVWELDEQTPFNWAMLDGTFMNEWNVRADYPDWTAFDDSHVEAMNDASITFGADGTVVVTQDDGTTASGTYTIDGQSKKITFQDVTPAIPIGGWAVAEPTAENEWKIILVERDANKEPTGIWFGKRDPEKDEYMVFHFVLN